jgi:hypothetical protein
MGDFGSAVLAVQNYIANFDVECEMLAFVIAPTARSNCKNGALLWLLFGGVWDNETRCGGLHCFAWLDHNAVI